LSFLGKKNMYFINNYFDMLKNNAIFAPPFKSIKINYGT